MKLPKAKQVHQATAFKCFPFVALRVHLAQHPDQLVSAVKLRIYRPPPGNPDKSSRSSGCVGKTKPYARAGY